MEWEMILTQLSNSYMREKIFIAAFVNKILCCEKDCFHAVKLEKFSSTWSLASKNEERPSTILAGHYVSLAVISAKISSPTIYLVG